VSFPHRWHEFLTAIHQLGYCLALLLASRLAESSTNRIQKAETPVFFQFVRLGAPHRFCGFGLLLNVIAFEIIA